MALAALPLEKLPPAAVETEQALIGGLLMDPTAVYVVREILTPEDFFRDSHRFVYEALLDLYERGTPGDIVTVTDHLERSGQLPQCGGVAYLHSLPGLCSSPFFVEHYAKIVKRTALKRTLISVGGRIAGIGYDDALDVDEALETAAELLGDISASRTDRHAGIFEITDIADRIQRLYDEGWTSGVETAWPELDIHYRPVLGDWTLIVGIPSHGKSTFTDALAYNLMVLHDWRFGFCSPENQPIERHARKLLQLHVGKPFDVGPVERMTLDELIDGEAWLQEHVKFVLPAEGQRSVRGVLSEMGAAIDKYGLTGVVIDPWNELEHQQEKHLREDQYLARALSDIRNFARQRRVHLFLIAHPKQMQRDESGKYQIVRPYDINGGAMWFNKADNCLSIYRDEHDVTQVHIQKIRFEGMNGKKGVVQLDYDRLTGRFSTPLSRQKQQQQRDQERGKPGFWAKQEEEQAR